MKIEIVIHKGNDAVQTNEDVSLLLFASIKRICKKVSSAGKEPETHSIMDMNGNAVGYIKVEDK